MATQALLQERQADFNRVVRGWDRRLRFQQTLVWFPRSLLPGLALGIALAVISRLRPWLLAGQIAAVVQEADRTARILDMGDWVWLVAEAEDGVVHLSRPADDVALVLLRDRSVPAGRLAVMAEKAAVVARQWLEAQL